VVLNRDAKTLVAFGVLDMNLVVAKALQAIFCFTLVALNTVHLVILQTLRGNFCFLVGWFI
jgi:hypothetical protein